MTKQQYRLEPLGGHGSCLLSSLSKTSYCSVLCSRSLWPSLLEFIPSDQTQVSLCLTLNLHLWSPLWHFLKETFFFFSPPNDYSKSLVCPFPESFVYDSLAVGCGPTSDDRVCWLCKQTMNTSRNLWWWRYRFTHWHNDSVTRRPASQVHVWYLTNCVRTAE